MQRNGIDEITIHVVKNTGRILVLERSDVFLNHEFTMPNPKVFGQILKLGPILGNVAVS